MVIRRLSRKYLIILLSILVYVNQFNNNYFSAVYKSRQLKAAATLADCAFYSNDVGLIESNLIYTDIAKKVYILKVEAIGWKGLFIVVRLNKACRLDRMGKCKAKIVI